MLRLFAHSERKRFYFYIAFELFLYSLLNSFRVRFRIVFVSFWNCLCRGAGFSPGFFFFKPTGLLMQPSALSISARPRPASARRKQYAQLPSPEPAPSLRFPRPLLSTVSVRLPRAPPAKFSLHTRCIVPERPQNV